MKPRLLQSIMLSWLSMIATDFLLHAGILARLYIRETPFLLSPEDAFVRIPLGYLSFLFLAILMGYVFYHRMPVEPGSGFREGIKIGAMVWLCFGMGLYSISTIDLELVTGWILGQTIEMGIGGYFLVLAMKSEKVSIVWKRLAIYVFIIIVVTIILQVTGMAPPMDIR